MYTYLNSNNLLAEQQYCFRKLHSTEYAAVNVIDHLAKQMESGHTPYNLYIDLSKAFWHFISQYIAENVKVLWLHCNGIKAIDQLFD